MLFYNLKLKKFSQDLRKNMTDAEKMVWSRIRRRQLKGLQIYRQRIIGNYIVDFYCPESKLVIEIDGGQHFTNEVIQEDMTRDRYLSKEGINVLRFSDREVFENLNGVIERIYENM